MKKLFLSETYSKNDVIEIQDKDYHHLIRTLRLKVGSSIIIGDGNNNEFVGVIKQIDKQKAKIELKNHYIRNKNNLPDVALFFGILKGDKNEILIQKCTEIGVNRFIPIFCENTIVKSTNIDKKILRWQKIAKEASQQCGRGKIPEIFDGILFEEIEKYVISNNKIFGLIDGEYSLKEYLGRGKAKSINLLIGPEGDFSLSEMSKLKALNWIGVRLIDSILKSETAAIFASSFIMSYYYN